MDKTINKEENHVEILFLHDRTCCVCRDANKKHIQIHHIDSNHQNDELSNLSVLCLDCHTETQIKGGFYKKLSAPLVIKYRDEWLKIVEAKKNKNKEEVGGGSRFRPNIRTPIDIFLEQFYKNMVLPINASFYFVDYFLDPQGFPTLVATSSQLTEDNVVTYCSISKAYLHCILGEIAPLSNLLTNSYEPSQSLKKVMVKDDIQIAVPNWIFKENDGKVNFIQILASASAKTKLIHFYFLPMFEKIKGDYSKFAVEMEGMVKQIKGKVIEI